MDAFGRKKLLVFNLIGTTISSLIYGFAIVHGGYSIYVVLSLACLTSLFISGVLAIMYMYTPELYPTSIRVTGTSWASAVSRIGSMIMPIIIPLTLALNGMATYGIFILISALFIMPIITVATIGVGTKGLSLDEI